VSLVDAATIDRINILEATCQAMRQSVAALNRQPDLLLVDAVKLGGVAMRCARSCAATPSRCRSPRPRSWPR
jgi:ribonuclease HII